MELHNKTFGYSTSTQFDIETNATNKEDHELGSFDLGHRCHNPESLSQSVSYAQCIHGQMIKAPSNHSFSEISGLNSTGESKLSSQSSEKRNIKPFGANLSIGSGKFSSNNIAKSMKVSENAYLHLLEGDILGSQLTSGNNSIRLFGSNLCLNGAHKPSVNQEKSKKPSEVLGLPSPMGSTLNSQSTFGNRDILLFGSNLYLRGRNISYVNQEKSEQPSNVQVLHSLRESSIASQPTPGSKIIRLFGSNLCPGSGNIAYINSDRSKQTSESLFVDKTSLCLSPYPNSHKITLEVEDKPHMEVHQVSPVGYNMSYHQGFSNNERETGQLGATHQIGSIIFSTEKVDLTSQKPLHDSIFKPTNLANTVEVNKYANSGEMIQATTLVQRQDTQEISFTSDGIANPVRSQDTQEVSFTSDEVGYGVISSHLHGTSFEGRSTKKQPDYDEFSPQSNIYREASKNQATQDIGFPIDKVELGTMLLPSHHRISEEKSTKRQRDYDKSLSRKQLFEEVSKSQKTQEISFTSDEVDHEAVSSPHFSKTFEAKYSRRQRTSYESLQKSHLCYETSETRSEIVLVAPNVRKEVNHGHVENEEDAVMSSPEVAIVHRFVEPKSPSKQSEEIVGDVQALDLTSLEEHVLITPSPLLLAVDSRNDVFHKRSRKKSQPTEFSKDVRSLLDIGILDGCPVFYYDHINKIKKWALIVTSYYLCGCPNCRYLKLVNAREFLRHCGCTSKWANKLIIFKTGHSVDSVVKKIRSAPDNMFKTISLLSGTVLNLGNFRTWMERNGMKEQATNMGTQAVQLMENQATQP